MKSFLLRRSTSAVLLSWLFSTSLAAVLRALAEDTASHSLSITAGFGKVKQLFPAKSALRLRSEIFLRNTTKFLRISDTLAAAIPEYLGEARVICISTARTVQPTMDMPIPDEVPCDLKQAGDILNAAQDVIDKISSFISPKMRGIVIQISNLTGLTLELKTTDFSSGGLEPSVLPAPLVGPFSQTVFGVKSDSIATGVVGSVTYESEGIDVLLCGFSNPFVGRTSVNVTLTGSRAPTLGCRAVISSGSHAAANFVLFDIGGFGIGDIVSLISFGSVPGARYLDGRTADGTVGLAPNTDVPFTGARWLVLDGGGGSFTLKSLGTIDGSRFLHGRTADRSVGLAPATDHPFTGTHWEITKLGSGVSFSLRCLGSIEAPCFLDGRTGNGTTGLAPSVHPPFTGTHWGIFRR